MIKCSTCNSDLFRILDIKDDRVSALCLICGHRYDVIVVIKLPVTEEGKALRYITDISTLDHDACPHSIVQYVKTKKNSTYYYVCATPKCDGIYQVSSIFGHSSYTDHDYLMGVKGMSPDKTPSDKTPGQVGYETYCDRTGWVSRFTNSKLPTWDAQDPGIKECWEASAQAVLNAFGKH